jgi:ABC-type nitrate/sulfonate/bicarbonate transport system substrate-binding protein
MRRVAVPAAGVAVLLALACTPTPPPAPASAGAAPGMVAAAAAPPEAGPAVSPAPTPVPIRYGISATSLTFIAARTAVEQGLFRRYGLDVELIQVAAGAMAAAQLAGELDYVTAYPGGIRAAAQGSPLRIVSTIVGAPLFVMLGRPEVATLADLRGQAVGITTRGGAIDKITTDLLAQVGLDAGSDVIVLATGAQTPLLLEALVSGRVQAAALSAPWFIRGRGQGMRVLANAPALVREPQNGHVVTDERLAHQRDQVVHVVQAEIEAIHFIRANRAATVALGRDWLDLTAAEAEEAYDFVLPALTPDAQIDVAGLERYVATEKAEGNLPPDFRLDPLLDQTVARDAARALALSSAAN